jgi:hypothetical protein
VLELIRGLCRQRELGDVLIQKPGFRLELRRA